MYFTINIDSIKQKHTDTNKQNLIETNKHFTHRLKLVKFLFPKANGETSKSRKIPQKTELYWYDKFQYPQVQFTFFVKFNFRNVKPNLLQWLSKRLSKEDH